MVSVRENSGLTSIKTGTVAPFDVQLRSIFDAVATLLKYLSEKNTVGVIDVDVDVPNNCQSVPLDELSHL